MRPRLSILLLYSLCAVLIAGEAMAQRGRRPGREGRNSFIQKKLAEFDLQRRKQDLERRRLRYLPTPYDPLRQNAVRPTPRQMAVQRAAEEFIAQQGGDCVLNDPQLSYKFTLWLLNRDGGSSTGQSPYGWILGERRLSYEGEDEYSRALLDKLVAGSKPQPRSASSSYRSYLLSIPTHPNATENANRKRGSFGPSSPGLDLRQQSDLAPTFDETIDVYGNRVVSTTLRASDADPTNELRVSYIDLRSQGDAILLRCPDDTLVLIDAGLSQVGYERIRHRIKERAGDKIQRVTVVITHEHADHLKGLRNLIDDPGIELDLVVLGYYKHTNLLDNITAALSETHLVIQEFTGMMLFVPERGGSSWLEFRSSESGDDPFSIHNVRVADGRVDLTIAQHRDPRSANESSLLVIVRHRNKSHLLTSDINPRVMADLMKSSLRSGLDVGVLKWPHHIWSPVRLSNAQRRSVYDFLRAVEPHTIIFSNYGANQSPEMYDEAVKFIREILGPGVRFYWTRPDGTIDLYTLRGRFEPPMLLAA